MVMGGLMKLLILVWLEVTVWRTRSKIEGAERHKHLTSLIATVFDRAVHGQR